MDADERRDARISQELHDDALEADWVERNVGKLVATRTGWAIPLSRTTTATGRTPIEAWQRARQLGLKAD